jgi:Farnesoic acid 0-methyl transferase
LKSRTITTPFGTGVATVFASYNGVLLSASAYRAFWISWKNGLIAIGTGSVVGLNGFMNFTTSSPEPVNYLSIGSSSNGSAFFLNYCKLVQIITCGG